MNLLGTSLLSALQTAFKIIAGFVLVKVVALSGGPQGIAQFGQFQNLVTVMSILCGGMFYTGVTKLIAEQPLRSIESLVIIQGYLKLSALMFCISVIFIFIWREYIAVQLLNNPSHGQFLGILPFLAFLSVLYGLWLAVLNGQRRIREMVIASIASSLLMIVLSLTLALPFGDIGAYIAVLAPPGVVLTIFLARNRQKFFSILNRKQTEGYSVPYQQMARFAVISLVSAVAAPLAQIAMRDYLQQNLSLEQAGIWQGVTRISEVYLVFITSSLGVYFLPKLAQVDNNKSLSRLIRSMLKLVVPVSIFLGVVVFFARDTLIYILFTPDFSAMRDLFLWQIIGDMVKIISWVFAYVVFVKGGALAFITGEIVFNISYPILGMLFVQWLGLQGAVVAYGVNYVFYLAYVYFLFTIIVKRGIGSNV